MRMRREDYVAMTVAFTMFAGCKGDTMQTVGMIAEPGTDGKGTAEPLNLTIFQHMGTVAFNYDM